MNKSEKGKRSSKTTRAQYQLYIDELEINEAFRENKFDAVNPDIIQNTWKKLSQQLNALGGPVRDVVGWKRTFTDWKSQTRARARKLKCAFKETGNVGDPPKPLNDLEEKLLDVTGKVVVDGMDGVPELGIEEPTNFKENIEEIGVVKERPSIEAELPSCSSKIMHQTFSKENRQPPTKKRKTLTGCLKEIMEKQPNEETVILREIATELKKIRQIEEKHFKLRQLELQVKYPDYAFVVDASDSE